MKIIAHLLTALIFHATLVGGNPIQLFYWSNQNCLLCDWNSGDSILTHFAFVPQHALNGHSWHTAETQLTSKVQPSAEHTKSSRVLAPGDLGWESPGAGHTTHPHCAPLFGRVWLALQGGACLEPTPLGTFTFVQLDAVWQHPVEHPLEGNSVAPPALHLRPAGAAKDQGSAKEQRHFIRAATTRRVHNKGLDTWTA